MEIKSVQTGSMAIVSVSENGKSISSAERNRILERFFQMDKSRTRDKNKGAGLRLSIAREIVMAHGSNIRVENNAPQVRVFLVKLPLI